MGSLLGFLEGLFGEGRVVLRGRPEPSEAERGRVEGLLREFFDEEALALAGPAPDFDPRAATWAAEWSWLACWFLVSRSEPEEHVGKLLRVPEKPGKPGQQLSADLTFRYLPPIHRRARSLAPDDLLTARLAELFRRWPLSGALSDVHEEPLSPLGWGRYFGLAHLYAERLARNPKPAWTPAEDHQAAPIVAFVLDRMERAGAGGLAVKDHGTPRGPRLG